MNFETHRNIFLRIFRKGFQIFYNRRKYFYLSELFCPGFSKKKNRVVDSKHGLVAYEILKSTAFLIDDCIYGNHFGNDNEFDKETLSAI